MEGARLLLNANEEKKLWEGLKNIGIIGNNNITEYYLIFQRKMQRVLESQYSDGVCSYIVDYIMQAQGEERRKRLINLEKGNVDNVIERAERILPKALENDLIYYSELLLEVKKEKLIKELPEQDRQIEKQQRDFRLKVVRKIKERVKMKEKEEGILVSKFEFTKESRESMYWWRISEWNKSLDMCDNAKGKKEYTDCVDQLCRGLLGVREGKTMELTLILMDSQADRTNVKQGHVVGIEVKKDCEREDGETARFIDPNNIYIEGKRTDVLAVMKEVLLGYTEEKPGFLRLDEIKTEEKRWWQKVRETICF